MKSYSLTFVVAFDFSIGNMYFEKNKEYHVTFKSELNIT